MIPLPLRGQARPCLELVNTGGPGTGTFDPTIEVSRRRPATLQYGDGSVEQKSGTSLSFSHTYNADDTWRARLRGVPLSELIGIWAESDRVTEIRHLRLCRQLKTLYAYSNPSLRISLRDVPGGVTILSLGGCSLLTGALSDVPGGVTVLYAYQDPLISPVGISALTKISDIRIYSNGYSSAVVDATLQEMYTHRMGFTAASPSLRIGGNNATPSGIYQNATPPTTGLEYVYKLVNDPDLEGFKKWAISWNGGSAP